MRKKTNISIFPLLIMGVFLVFASSCSKDDNNDPASNNPTNGKTTAVFNSAVTYGTMTDQDGNIYKTVTIGTQTWMAENLRTTKYNDGTAISNVTGATEWASLTTGAYCNYNNTTNTDTIATYGRLYNWYAVNTGKLAPTGWHVPTDAEWSTLTDYLGVEYFDGGIAYNFDKKLKETGTTHWIWHNHGTANVATNETGFTALPGGCRSYRGSFSQAERFGDAGSWWSSTGHQTWAGSAWYRQMWYNSAGVIRDFSGKQLGYSVRCIKD